MILRGLLIAGLFISSITLARDPVEPKAKRESYVERFFPRDEWGSLQPEVMPDSGGTFSNVYTNDYFGFSYTMPPSWIAMTLTPYAGKRSRAAADAYGLLRASKYLPGTAHNPSLVIIAIDVSGIPYIRNGGDFLKLFMTRNKQIWEKEGIEFEIRETANPSAFGGRIFYKTESTLRIEGDPKELLSAQYSTIVKQHALVWWFGTGDKKSLKELCKTLRSLDFSARNE